MVPVADPGARAAAGAEKAVWVPGGRSLRRQDRASVTSRSMMSSAAASTSSRVTLASLPRAASVAAVIGSSRWLPSRDPDDITLDNSADLRR